jgi:hypothetical protein
VAIVALNTATTADPITYSLSRTGTPNDAIVTGQSTPPGDTVTVTSPRAMGAYSAISAAVTGRQSRGGYVRPWMWLWCRWELWVVRVAVIRCCGCRAAQVARRRTSQTVAAMSSTDSASSQPLSIH